MTWTASLLPDDALPPDSLVKRIIDADKADSVTWETPTEIRAKGARVSGANSEPIAEFVFDERSMKDGETYRLTYDAETGTVRPELLAETASERADLPLWRVMLNAGMHAERCDPGTARHSVAAEIEALRDWLLPEEATPLAAVRSDLPFPMIERLDERQRLRAQLTEQARIAREGS